MGSENVGEGGRPGCPAQRRQCRLACTGCRLGSVTIILETGTASHDPVDADVSVLLLDENGRVRSNDDFIFYNQPIALDGAVHLRDKIRSEPDDNDVVLSTDILTLELDDVPESISRIVIAASLDPETAITFGDARFVQLRLQRTSDASDLLVYRIEDAQSERALMVGELYRRAGEWRLRAIGLGYSDGLAGLATEFGIDVDSSTDDAGVPSPPRRMPNPRRRAAHHLGCRRKPIVPNRTLDRIQLPTWRQSARHPRAVSRYDATCARRRCRLTGTARYRWTERPTGSLPGCSRLPASAWGRSRSVVRRPRCSRSCPWSGTSVVL